MKNILFICSQNKLRSPTAETIFCNYKNISVRSAGLDHDAVNRLSSEDLEWADIVFVMEGRHKKKLNRNFKEFIKDIKIYVLNIPDEYDYMDDELIRIFKKKIPNYINL